MNVPLTDGGGAIRNPFEEMIHNVVGAVNGVSQYLGSQNKGKRPSGGRRPAAQSGGGAAPAPAPSGEDWILALMEAQQKARDEAYRAAAAAQRQNYEYAQGQLDSTTDRALQEAYVNKMLTLRDLSQQMAGQGLSGGASETSLAGLYNNYGNARNELETERQQQMAALLNAYQNNMAKLEAERASGVARELASLTPQLTKLAAGNKPMLLTLTQGAGPQQSAAAAMRRLRSALGLEEE